MRRFHESHVLQRRMWRLALVAMVATVLTTSAACVVDRGESVRIENHSDRIVLVYENNIAIDLMHPNVSQDFAVLANFQGTEVFEVRNWTPDS